MPIYREVEVKNKDGSTTITNVPIPDFTYSSDCLAQMIVDAWTDKKYRDSLLDRVNGTVTDAAAQLATFSVNKCGFNLQRAVVITEAEFYAPPNGYKVQTPNEVVFVLPDLDRVQLHPGPLLKTAELLMATTPNGI